MHKVLNVTTDKSLEATANLGNHENVIVEMSKEAAQNQYRIMLTLQLVPI